MNKLASTVLAAIALTTVAATAPRADLADGVGEVASEVRALARGGDPAAQYVLGTMYRDGVCLSPDSDKARAWLHRAAEQGLIDAQLALGNLYIRSDRAQSYKWFGIAAAHAREDWLREIAGSNRDAVAGGMTSAEIARARAEAEGWRAKPE